MRILLLVDCYPPSVLAGAQLMHDLALELAEDGHAVTVMTPDDALKVPLKEELIRSVRVVRVRSGKVKRVPNWIRAFNEWRLPYRFWAAGRTLFDAGKFQLVVAYSPTIFWAPLLERLKRQYGASTYLVLRDIFPQWAVDAGHIRRGGVVHKCLSWFEGANYRAADVIGVQSPANLEYFEKVKSHAKLEVLFNWTRVLTIPSATGALARRGLQGKIVFIYGGNIGVAQDVARIVRLAERLKDEPSIHFLLVGDGSEARRIRDDIKQRCLTNISLHGSMPQDKYLALLSECDVGLVSLRPDLTTQNFPGKLLGYMQCARPILASINAGNDLRSMLEENDAGLVVINGDDDDFAAKALALAKDAALRKRLGLNARNLLDRYFSASSAARQVLSHFN